MILRSDSVACWISRAQLCVYSHCVCFSGCIYGKLSTLSEPLGGALTLHGSLSLYIVCLLKYLGGYFTQLSFQKKNNVDGTKMGDESAVNPLITRTISFFRSVLGKRLLWTWLSTWLNVVTKTFFIPQYDFNNYTRFKSVKPQTKVIVKNIMHIIGLALSLRGRN